MSESTIKKQMLNGILAFACATTASLASAQTVPANSFYLGLDVGGARTGNEFKSSDFTDIQNVTFDVKQTGDTKLAGRIYLGYQYNDYVGAELGYLLAQSSSDTIGPFTSGTTTVGPFNSSIKVKPSGDLVLVGTIPLEYNFGLFGKLGFSYLSTSSTIQGQSVTEHRYPLTFGAGFSYDVDNVRVKLGWDRIQASGNILNTDFVYLGVSYYFGSITSDAPPQY